MAWSMSATETNKRGKSIGKIVVRGILGIGLLLTGLTFFWFVAPVTDSVESVEPADAVVVFVGGDNRFDTAVALIESGAAERLVIPNARNGEVRTSLCDRPDIEVFCPDSRTIDTKGEAQVIGHLAREQGWTRVIAVTSPYHVHRATYQLSQCFPGSISAVSADTDLDRDDWSQKVVHEWVGTLAAMTFQRAC